MSKQSTKSPSTAPHAQNAKITKVIDGIKIKSVNSLALRVNYSPQSGYGHITRSLAIQQT